MHLRITYKLRPTDHERDTGELPVSRQPTPSATYLWWPVCVSNMSGSEKSTPYPSHLLAHIGILFPVQPPTHMGAHECRSAHHTQSALWHPDKAPSGCSQHILESRGRRQQLINQALEVLLIEVSSPHWSHNPPSQASSDGGQRGRGRGTAKGGYTLRTSWFEGTISGFKQGELTVRSVEAQLDAIIKKLNREIQDVVIGVELHKTPAHPAFDHHIHFVIRVDQRLCHKSGKCARTARSML
jgi:hypothetical protein